MGFVYLDWAATSPPDAAILERSGRAAAEYFANPSSPHTAGVRARQFLEDCRGRLAAVLGCSPEEVLFTSGGTEANNMVLFSLLRRKRDRRVILSGIEHDSLHLPAQRLGELGGEAVVIPAGRDGRVDPERIAAAVDERTVLVALMRVNNESGAVQPVAELAELLRRRQASASGRRVLLHTDAVQALGKLPFHPGELGVDTAAFSAHKLGGPRGVGALYVRKGSVPEFLYAGGGQESGRRPGTENLAGAYALAEAAEQAVSLLEGRLDRARELMDWLIAELASIPGCRILPEQRSAGQPPEHYSPFIVSTALPPLPGEVLVRAMGEEGFLISTGAACSSRKQERTRVLEAMGVDRKLASCAVRISIGPATEREELARFLEALRRRLPALLGTRG
jgi:cysteine desulfurase